MPADRSAAISGTSRTTPIQRSFPPLVAPGAPIKTSRNSKIAIEARDGSPTPLSHPPLAKCLVEDKDEDHIYMECTANLDYGTDNSHVR
jgi:hypothetical protein